MSKSSQRWILIGVVLAMFVLVLAWAMRPVDSPASGDGPAETPVAQTPADTPAPEESPATAQDATGLVIEDLGVGEGPEAVSGNAVTVHYTGWLTDGTQFDSSLDSGQPFQFTLGQGDVIAGWDVGVAGMKAGGKRKLTIPPEMGYGEQGAGAAIPPNATLVFEVELLAIQ